MYSKHTLKNGLHLITVPKKDCNSVKVSFYFRGGSRFDPAKKEGIAHFLEHMVFKGSSKFPTQLDFARFAESIGASYDGSTDVEAVTFFIHSEASYLGDILEALKSMLFEPLLKNEDIDKEKAVIIEEIRTYNDMPEYKAHQGLSALLWPQHPLGGDIAGNIESVSSLTRDDLAKFHSGLIGGTNLVIGVSGNFDDSLFEKVNAIAKLSKGSGTLVFEPSKDLKGGPFIHTEKTDTEQVHFNLGFRGLPRSHPKKEALRLFSVIFGGGMSSRLFKKIRMDLGLAYYINSAANFYLDSGAFVIGGGVNSQNYLKALEAVVEEIKTVLEEGITENELERAKKNLKGLLAIHLEDHAELNEFLARQELLLGEVLDYKETIKKLERFTVDEINSLIRSLLTEDSLSICCVGKVDERPISKLLNLR